MTAERVMTSKSTLLVFVLCILTGSPSLAETSPLRVFRGSYRHRRHIRPVQSYWQALTAQDEEADKAEADAEVAARVTSRHDEVDSVVQEVEQPALAHGVPQSDEEIELEIGGHGTKYAGDVNAQGPLGPKGLDDLRRQKRLALEHGKAGSVVVVAANVMDSRQLEARTSQGPSGKTPAARPPDTTSPPPPPASSTSQAPLEVVPASGPMVREADVVPAASDSSSECNPQCTWQCETPICDQVCEPICQPPRCETRCGQLDFATCSPKCGTQHCAVVCPKNPCASKDCARCQSVCDDPHCTLSCPGVQPCHNVCEEPSCEWKCRAPEHCPAPKCRLTCSAPKSCSTTMYKALPPRERDERVVEQFSATDSVIPRRGLADGAETTAMSSRMSASAKVNAHAQAETLAEDASEARPLSEQSPNERQMPSRDLAPSISAEASGLDRNGLKVLRSNGL